MPKPTTSHLVVLDAIPYELIPAAITRLSARLLHPLDIPDGPLRSLPDAGERYYTPDEVAARLGRHRNWVYDYAEQMGAVRLSHRALAIPASGLERFIEQQRRKVKR